jgi:hypothetical protein
LVLTGDKLLQYFIQRHAEEWASISPRIVLDGARWQMASITEDKAGRNLAHNRAPRMDIKTHLMTKKRKKLRGCVQKVINPIIPGQSEKAQIEVHEAEHLYREIRVENVLTDDKGNRVRLRPGEAVDVTVEAESDSTGTKP